MPPIMNIKSDIVDIRSDAPVETDSFFIDTNVLYWMTYTKISYPGVKTKSYQLQDYPQYAKNADTVNSKIYCTGLNLSELVHLIEVTEYELYKLNVNASITKKNFRHTCPIERTSVCEEIEIACASALQLAKQIAITIDDKASDKLVNGFAQYRVDGYDLMNLHAMLESGITQIITDDGDFASAEGLTVFTANRNIIEQAKLQGKLVKRQRPIMAQGEAAGK